jgi:3-oxoacyl-[acyl-carrier protein] reductase
LTAKQRTLEGQVAVVTGAARGLGRAYAVRLAGLGAHVAVVDIDLESFKQYEVESAAATAGSTTEEVRALGVEALGIEADVRDPDAIGRAIREVIDRWGQIDVLVCNAGGGSRGESHASQVDLAEFDAVMRLNLYGTVNTVVAAAPSMKAMQRGKIITVSSQAGRMASRDGWYSHYGVTKSGIIMYTRYLAQEMGPYGVTANCIAPGYMATARLMASFERSEIDRLTSEIAVRRLGKVEECAGVIEFLATDLSDFVTGAVIPVDGGAVR